MKDNNLAIGYILEGADYSYRIEGVLGQGSFGITYLATTKVQMVGKLGNLETEVKVAIKEFFMKEFCSRHEDGTITEMTDGSLVQNYSKKFRKEAENLAKLSHPGIVNVLEVFEANNTCYYAMQYIAGGSLDAYVKSRGGLPEAEAIDCIHQIGEAVQYMHNHKMLHLDLKPGNVMRTEDGKKMILIDFGLSKQYTNDGNPESSTTVGMGTPGYAPLEQSKLDRDKDFAPTLDVYALGATFYKLLTGTTPPDSSDVLNEGLPIERLERKGLSQTSIAAIEKAMEPRKPSRVQSVAEFLAILDGAAEEDDSEQTVVPVSKPEQAPQPNPSPKPVRKGFPKWLYGLIAGVLVAVLAALLLNRPDKSDAPDNLQADSTSVVSEAKPETPAVVELKSISLSKTSLELEEGSSATLTVKYSPSNATDKATTWKSTDASIAKVSASGKVTAVKAGSAAIIASCQGKIETCTVIVKTSTTGTHAGHEWVDLGLSVKWATCNVGASSPEGYGSYFAWGETSPKSEYTWATLKYCNDTSGDSFSKYNQNQGGTRDNRTTLEFSDDAARANWGGSWRMPTNAEFQELINKCTWTWTTMNGKNGYKVASKVNGNSIFLPAAGYRYGTSLGRVGSYGYYWSSSLDESYSYSARYLSFDSGTHNTYHLNRRGGRSVRPVLR